MANNNEVAKSCVDLLKSSAGKFKACDAPCKTLFKTALDDVERQAEEITRNGLYQMPDWNPDRLLADCVALETRIDQEMRRLESLRTVLGTCVLFLRKTHKPEIGEMANENS